MPDFCLSQILDASKGILDNKSAKSLLNELRQRAKKKRLDEKLSKADSFNKTIDEILEEEKRELDISKKNAYRNIQIRKSINTFIDGFKDPTTGLRAYLDGVLENVKNGRKSTGALQKSYLNEFTGKLWLRLSQEDVLDAFTDKNFDSDIASALFDEDSIGNIKVKKVARAIKDTYKDILKLLNAAGAAIADLPEYIARNTHRPEKMITPTDKFIDNIKLRFSLRKQGFTKQEIREKIYSIAYTRWRDYIYPRLDRERTFKHITGTEEEFLRSAYDAIVSGIHLKPIELQGKESDIKFTGPANRAKRLSQRRKIHFKDGRSWYEYNKKYGSGSTVMSILSTIQNGARNLSLLEKFGTNPDAMFDNIVDEVRRKSIRDLKFPTSKVNRSLNFSDAIYKDLSGYTQIPVDTLWANIHSSFRAYTNMTKLGQIFASSLNDFALRASLMRDHGEGFLDTYSTALKQAFRGKTPKDEKELAALLGTWAQSQFGYIAHRFMAVDTPIGVMSKTMQYFFKLTGIEWLDQLNRGGIAIGLAKRLSQFRNSSFDSIPEGERSLLDLYGIGDKEWALITHKDNLQKAWKNEIFITPDSARYYSEDSINDYLGSKASPSDVDRIRREMENNLRTYFIDQTDMGHLQPGATERAFFIRGTRPGTAYGEFARYMSQFRLFSLGYIRRSIGRYLFRKGGIRNMQFKDVMGLIELVAMSTAFGYVSITTKDVLKGILPPTFDRKNYLKILSASILQGGGLGIFGDFLFGESDRFGHSFLGDLGPPAFGTIDDAAKLFLQLAKLDNPNRTALHILENNTLFINLWFTRTFFNYLFLWGLQEKVSPGSTRRMIRNLKKNQDAKYIINPFDAVGV